MCDVMLFSFMSQGMEPLPGSSLQQESDFQWEDSPTGKGNEVYQ